MRKVSATIVAVSLVTSALSIPQTQAEDIPGFLGGAGSPTTAPTTTAPTQTTEKSPLPFTADNPSPIIPPESTTPVQPTDTTSTAPTTETTETTTEPTTPAPPAEKDSSRYAPSYSTPSPVQMGQSESTKGLVDQVPAGTTFSAASEPNAGWETSVNAYSGAVTAMAVQARDIPGTLRQRVLVSYPDGSSEQITAIFQVDKSRSRDSEKFQPAYSDSKVSAGQSVTVAPQWNGARIPSEANFGVVAAPEGFQASVDARSGQLRVSAEASKRPGSSARLLVTVRYADGSQDEVTAEVRVPSEKDQDPNSHAATLNPSVRDIAVSTDRVSTAFVEGGPFPQSTVFSVLAEDDSPVSPVIDAHSGRLTLIPNASARPGMDAEIHVTANYPDKSVDVVPARIRVVDDSHTMAGQANAEYPRSTVPFGESTTVRPRAQLPEGTKFFLATNAPQGWDVRVDEVTGVVQVKVDPSIREVIAELPIRMEFSDGSQGLTLAPVSVVNLANNMRVTYAQTDIAFGASTQVPVEGAPYGASYQIEDGLSDGWEAAIVDDGTVEVATPKGSTREESTVLTIRVNFPDNTTAITTAIFRAAEEGLHASPHIAAKGPEARTLNEVVDQLDLKDYIDPNSGKLTKPMPADMLERVQAVYGASGNGESLNTDGQKDVVVSTDGMLNMASIGLPFVKNKIRSGQIRVAGS